MYTVIVCLGVAFIEALGVVELCKLNVDIKVVGVALMGLTAVCITALALWFATVEVNKDSDD